MRNRVRGVSSTAAFGARALGRAVVLPRQSSQRRTWVFGTSLVPLLGTAAWFLQHPARAVVQLPKPTLPWQYVLWLPLLPHPHELLHRLRPPCRTRCQHNTKTDATTDANADDEPRPYCVNRDAAAYSASPISTSNVPLQLTLPSWVVPPPAPPCADQLRSAEPACRPVPCPSPLTVPSPYTACRHIPAQRRSLFHTFLRSLFCSFSLPFTSISPLLHIHRSYIVILYLYAYS